MFITRNEMQKVLFVYNCVPNFLQNIPITAMFGQIVSVLMFEKTHWREHPREIYLIIGLLITFQCFDVEDTWAGERIAGQITLIIGLLRAHSPPCCHHITQLLVSNAQIRLFPGKKYANNVFNMSKGV